MEVYRCLDCGHLEFSAKPSKCPVCAAPADKFIRNDRVFEESAEKSKEAAVKHVPAVTVNKACGLIPDQGCIDVIVRIGATLHPMEDAHFIRFIDCYVDNAFISRIILTPGVFPAGCFHLKKPGTSVAVVESCSIHGYWKTEINL